MAQGDSASVLAVNILMTGWSAALSSIPNLDHYAFIDDAYIMSSGEHIKSLCSALQATRLYDQSVGQRFNILKSEAWATTKRAKELLRFYVPEIPISDTFQVLGTFIRTNAKSRTIDAGSTAQIMRNVVHDVVLFSMQKKALSP